MIRNFLAVLAGLIVAVLVFVVFEQINHSIFPLQKSADGGFIIPTQFLLVVIVGWLIGSFLAGLIVKLISQSNSKILPLIAGIILTLSGIANLFAVSHPLWFAVISILIFVPTVFFGHSIYKIKKYGQSI